MGCSKRKRVAPLPVDGDPADTNEDSRPVESIYRPLSQQSAFEEPHKWNTEKVALLKLKGDGLLKSEILMEKANGNVSFFVPLDGNAYPLGKPRLLEPVELKQERERIKIDLAHRIANATRLRRERRRFMKIKARMASTRHRQAVARRGKANEERRGNLPREDREETEEGIQEPEGLSGWCGVDGDEEGEGERRGVAKG